MEIIAEIGSTWWRLDKQEAKEAAFRSIRGAAYSGATAAKFQLFRADKLYSKKRMPKQWKSAKQYELPLDWLPTLKTCASDNGIKFVASVFDANISNYAAPYLDIIKVASGDVTNLALIKKVARLSKEHEIPMLLSTGASTENEVKVAIETAKAAWHLTIMQCVSNYPADATDYNLDVFNSEVYQMADKVGLSDHTLNNELASIAVGVGYRIFEKHFMLNETPEDCSDSVVSLNPVPFEWYCRDLKWALEVVGNSVKSVQDSERNERIWARRGKDGLRPNDKN